jgi:hypothetical protein
MFGESMLVWVSQELGLFASMVCTSSQSGGDPPVRTNVGSERSPGGQSGRRCALEGADTFASPAPCRALSFSAAIRRSSVNGSKAKVSPQRPATSYATRMVFAASAADKDVKFRRAMPASSMLKSGNAVAGLMSVPTTFQARELGLKPILNVTDLNIPFVFVGVATTRKVLQQKPDAITRFLRAYTESIAIIRRDKETALKAMGKFLKTDNRVALEGIYEEYGNAFQRVPLMTKEAVQAVLDVAKSPKAQQMKPEDFFDNSFLQKLDDSGFINSLYAR